MGKKLLMFSGGPDSTAAAYLLKKELHDVHLMTLSDDVKAKNDGEVAAAKRIAKMLGMPHKIIDISSLNALLDGLPNILISLGTGGEKKSDFVHGEEGAPLSSQLLHTLCAVHGIAHGFDSMIWGVHQNDDQLAGPGWIAGYTARFNAVLEHSGFSFRLETPYLHLTKTQLMLGASTLGAPFHETFSCLTPGAKAHCGKCEACRERFFALQEIETLSEPRVLAA